MHTAGIVVFCVTLGIAVAELKQCPKIFFPKCGVDGQVYDNPCLLKNAEVEEADSFEKCRGHELCPSDCTDDYRPVCGYDGVLYLNRCTMQSENCGKLMGTFPLDECQ